MSSHLNKGSCSHNTEKEPSMSSPPKTSAYKKWGLTLLVIIAILVTILYPSYLSLSVIFNYLYRQPPRVVSYSDYGDYSDPHYEDNDYGYGYDDFPYYPSVHNIYDIWGSSIQALDDEYYSPAKDYVPIYSYEEYRLSPPKPVKRYDLEYDKVACWQDGGVWIKKLSPVEMLSLGVDRFQDTERAARQADEDDFCARLRMHGASFWTLPAKLPPFKLWCSTVECVEPAKKANFEAGFPTTGGGVWLLNTTSDDVTMKEPLFIHNVALKNALTMDERCNAIKSLGGVFCNDVNDCIEIDNLLAA